jgi:5-methylcytosine-specific restriction endonuclease McrA
MPDAYHRAEYRHNRLAVLEAAGWRCEWPGCGRPANSCDHILPLSQGGGNTLGNLRASCHRCNSQGGAKITNEIKVAKRVGRRSRRW